MGPPGTEAAIADIDFLARPVDLFGEARRGVHRFVREAGAGGGEHRRVRGNRSRLTNLGAEHDPGNLFRGNQNIRPTG